MTVTNNSSPPLSNKDAAVIRKRRRRAPAGGASDDCFACSRRNVKCDRRRPYCSQCLEIGNECSGYKTQLTWGVGVASRGKLRGLSLPIAKAPPVAPQGKKVSPARSRANSAAATASWPENDEHPPLPPTSQPADDTASQPQTPYTPYDIPLPMSGETTPSVPHGSWPGGIPFPSKLTTHLHLPVTTEALSSSVDSLSDVDYMSPLSHSFSREDLPFVNSPRAMYESYTSHSSPVPQSPVFIEHRPAPTSCPSLVYAPSEPGSSIDSHMVQKTIGDCDSLGVPDLEFSSSYQSTAPSWPSQFDEEHHTGGSQAPWASTQGPVPHHLQISADLTSRMPFFIDYYQKTMCPSMVLIDSPKNPYREHILNLAQNSPSLRHAICALSACNLRMKRRLSLNQHSRENSEAKLVSDDEAVDQSVSEEYQHRNLAVHLLNQQLNDPSKSVHDSVLATILLLCHYRMVESGIAKFHTQFAGVKKILSMRKSTQYQVSREAGWMEAIFTYFDAISASINDREAQINTNLNGIMGDTHILPPGAENLVGCDRELFKTIGKLGRLNMLAQNKTVQSAIANGAIPRGIPSRSQSPLGSPMGHSYKTSQSSIPDFFSIPAHRFDGNGFATTLDEEQMLAAMSCASPTYEDTRATFWREWKEARAALQNWAFDAQSLINCLPGTTTTAQIGDLHTLSEAFRYAALLYTERLASPSTPSSHNHFNSLVTQVVYYATSLKAGSSAEKFLLWPLFVAGSECVNELHQNMIRSKCRDIMSRSGYMNNLAALDVLEQVWAGGLQSQDVGRPPVPGRSPLTWTKYICGAGVEVEWIMF